MQGRRDFLIDGALKDSVYQGDHFSNNIQYIRDFNESQVFHIAKKNKIPPQKAQVFAENNKNNQTTGIQFKDSYNNGDNLSNNYQNFQTFNEPQKQFSTFKALKNSRSQPEERFQNFEELNKSFQTTRLEEPENEEIRKYFQTNSIFSATQQTQSKRKLIKKPEKKKDSENSIFSVSQQTQSKNKLFNHQLVEKPEESKDSSEKFFEKPPQVAETLNIQPQKIPTSEIKIIPNQAPKIPTTEVKTMPNQAPFGLFQNLTGGPTISQFALPNPLPEQQPPPKPKVTISDSVQNFVIPQNNPMILEINPPPAINNQNNIQIAQAPKPKPEEEKKIDNPPAPTFVSHEQIFLKNIQNTANVQNGFAELARKIPPQAKDDIEGEIKKGIGHLFGSSLLRLFETAEEFIKLYDKYRRYEEIIIFFASQIVKITLAGQVDNSISDKEIMRNRLGRIAILLHFINLHCSCLIDFVIGIITTEIPLLIPKDNVDGHVEKNLQKVEYYAYFYFSLICLDLNSFFSNSHLKQIERDFLKQYQHDPEATNNFYATRDRMLRFLRSKNQPAIYHEYYWKFVELFFKRTIKEQTVVIAISFCYASYFIWKKEGEGEKIIKIMKKIKEVFLPKLRNEYNVQMKTNSEKNRCRIDCNRLEKVVEDAVNSKELPSFVENKDDD